jgi:hypothetical protein
LIVKSGHSRGVVSNAEGARRGKVHAPSVQVRIGEAGHARLVAGQVELVVAGAWGPSIFQPFELEASRWSPLGHRSPVSASAGKEKNHGLNLQVRGGLHYNEIDIDAGAQTERRGDAE